MYLFDQNIEDTLITICSDILKFPVIWERQDAVGGTFGVRPALPFCTLAITTPVHNICQPDRAYKADGAYRYKYHKVFTLTATIFAMERHLEHINLLIDALELDTMKQRLYAAGIAYLRHFNVVDLTELQETGTEHRAAVDILLGTAIERVDVPGEIVTTSISSDMKGKQSYKSQL